MNNMKKEQLRLYAVTDRTWLGNETLYEQVEKALEGGATLVQLREKELPEADVQKEAEELLELCHRYGVKLILDDDVELAAKVSADGVHIGQSDMELAHAREILGPDKIIGVTAKMPLTTATPAMPLPFNCKTFSAVIPPIATTGIFTLWQISSSSSCFIGMASFLVVEPNTAPLPR